MKGRKPSRAKLAVVRGPVDADKPARPSRPAASLPPPPIALDGKALRVYREIGQVLFDRGMVVDTDLLMFAIFCRTVAEYLDASERLADEGPQVVSDSGGNKLSGWLSVVRETRRFLTSLGGEFALTPIGRLRADVSGNPAGDDLDEFIRQAKA